MNGKILIIICALFLCATVAMSQTLSPIELPVPQTTGGKPLMQALKDRHTSREFAPDPLPPQVLSNLLWAAYGFNRPEIEHRTAPSAMNNQETSVYVFLKEGVYEYNAKANMLNPVVAGDYRSIAGKQDFVKEAPLNLVYVADYAKMGEGTADDHLRYSYADAGFIAENVYLFCASENLSCVVRAWVDHEQVASTLKLRPDQKVLLGQTIGYPKK
ncbi:SagB/ThcOx family dehydrogenase [candidate division KSB1 bacterium]|nr:MAG: SagB/ThcOx family dehydrogenase [candidate division KSB1 bacterium]